jgi:hypothetical protein
VSFHRSDGRNHRKHAVYDVPPVSVNRQDELLCLVIDFRRPSNPFALLLG